MDVLAWIYYNSPMLLGVSLMLLLISIISIYYLNKSESLKAALENAPIDKSKIIYPTDVTIVYSKECPIMQKFIKRIVEDLRSLGHYNLNFKTFVSSFEKFDFNQLYEKKFFIFLVCDNSPSLEQIEKYANYWTNHELDHILYAIIQVQNTKQKTTDSMSKKFYDLLNYAGSHPFMNYMECDEENYEDTYSTWSPHFLFRFSKKFSKSFNQKLPKGFSISTFTNDYSNDSCVNEDIDSTTDLEDIINEKIISGVEDDSKTRYSKDRPMITERQKKHYNKQGYTLVGTHSAVKMCRWAKNQLKGEGACYKHTFYGITSYKCMESSASLACANRCIFCWRHHTNPVGREWRWKMDNPDEISNGLIEAQHKIINEARFIKGIDMNKLEDAKTPAHCALSLVGESIMYPEINKLMQNLHDKRISTFLVTNGQFPDEMESLTPVTQLYVSIDASNSQSLKNIDQPLFEDYWYKYLKCIELLKNRCERTVFRITLIKGMNMDNINEYVKLVNHGEPDFIEIKGMTYFGSNSNSSDIKMDNCPWHEDVREFSESLVKELPEYGLACEHKHSCCILIGRKDRYYKNNKWYTWIDFEKFFELEKNYRDNNVEFKPNDYCLETPEWSYYNSSTNGFDPNETHVSYSGRSRDEVREEKLNL